MRKTQFIFLGFHSHNHRSSLACLLAGCSMSSMRNLKPYPAFRALNDGPCNPLTAREDKPVSMCA